MIFGQVTECGLADWRTSQTPERSRRKWKGDPMKLRVFLIDDDQRIRDLVQDVVEERGHKVYAFTEPFRCPILLNEKCYCPDGWQCGDLFITDLEMPGMSGIDFIANQVRFGCRGLTENTAVMSGGWTDSELARARELGCRTFHKPFDLEEFISWIETCERRANPARGLTAMCVDRQVAQ